MFFDYAKESSKNKNTNYHPPPSQIPSTDIQESRNDGRNS